MKYEIRPPQAIFEIGLRENQEDCIFPEKGKATSNDRLFILCDGMGGHQSGEVASQTVCEEIGKYVLNETDPTRPFTDAMLANAIEKAYDALDGKDHSESDKKMGTTMVFLYFHAGGVMAAHIGDSRYYHIRPKTREIRYRSRDHSLANITFEAGEVSLKDLATMPGRNVILRAMMPHQDVREMPDIVHIKDIRPGDYFFACSDGILERMNDEELLNVICNKDLSDEQKRDWLLTSTDGNKDNHSAWLIQVTGIMAEEIDEDQPDDEAEARMQNKLLLAELGELTQDWHDEAEDMEDSMQLNSAPSVMPNQEYTVEESTPKASYSTPPHEKDSGKKNLWLWIALAALAIIACVAICFAVSGRDDKKPTQIKYEEVERERRYQLPENSVNSNTEDVVSEPVTREQQSTATQKQAESSGTAKPRPTTTTEKNKNKRGVTLNPDAIKDQLGKPTEQTSSETMRIQESVDRLKKNVGEQNQSSGEKNNSKNKKKDEGSEKNKGGDAPAAKDKNKSNGVDIEA